MNASGDGGPDAGRLTLYSNGFLVGPEDAKDPMFFCSVAGPPINASPDEVRANQAHMADIARGVVPKPVEDIVRSNLAGPPINASPDEVRAN